jgi:hypothetical protein
MSIEEVENLDGSEVDQWRHHFAQRPFTVDLLDYIGAHICQSIVASMGSGKKKTKIEDFLLINRKKKRLPKSEKEFRAVLGG